jgi:hypothetical protein
VTGIAYVEVRFSVEGQPEGLLERRIGLRAGEREAARLA